ncbi:MFS transporter [Mycobacterium sp. 155]|uniref:MFS transporter n=1 Tax=Mycobacterium sp. 155 TaxID=1157943 RepID=UPI0003A87D35|nr:MFS transporter [Mycobacterium sp. 155]
MTSPVVAHDHAQIRDWPRQIKRAVLGAAVGNILEWYDYFVYGTLAGLVFPTLFFPEADRLTGTVASFATFFVGFLARPIGALIFGHFGDKHGRKNTLLVSLLIMCGGSLAIGLLPTYNHVGIWAPILLVVFRFVQGVGVGGEWGGAVTLAAEWAPNNRRGLVTSFVELAAPIATLIAVAAVSVSSALSGENFDASNWTAGWRWPFYASIVIAVIGFYLRMKVDESPEFLAAKETQAKDVAKGAEAKTPLIVLLRTQWREVILCAMLRAAENSSYYIFTTFAVPLAVLYVGMKEQTILNTITIASAVSIPVLLYAGHLSDRLGRAKVYMGSAVFMMFATIVFFGVLQWGGSAIIIAAFCLSLVPWAAHYGAQPALILESFNTLQRYSGASLGYQIASPLWGGLSPLIATLLLSISVWLVAGYLIALCIMTIVATAILVRVVKRSFGVAGSLDTGNIV